MLFNKNKNRFLTLLDFSGKFKYFSILGCIFSAISAVCSLIPFVYIWKFINALFVVFPNFSKAQGLEGYAINAFIFAILGIAFNFAGLMLTHLSAFRNERNMKEITLKHLVSLPLGYFSNKSSGNLRKIIDVNSAQTEAFLAHQLPDLVAAIVTPIVFIILLFSFDLILGFICLIPIIICFLMFIPMMGGKNADMMVKYQECLEDMNGQAVEYIRGMPVTKTFQQSLYSFKNFYKAIKNYGKFASEYSFSTQLPMTTYTVSINGFFAFLIPAVILLMGSVFNMDLLMNFIFYIIFTPMCAVMMNKIMMVSQYWMLASQSLSKIEEILNEQSLPESPNPQVPREFNIDFNNVCFSYSEDKEVLKNININIKEGETIALVGPSGSGKTTIASLIPRFWDVDSGNITIGGIDVRDISQEVLMEKVSFVFQNTQLFKDTIVNNVTLGRKVTKGKVLNALKLAQCEDIIEKLPDGIDTVIGKEGVYVSGGEQQRIALARAILKDAPIVVLDEATALADPENESKIQKALTEITRNKTTIMVAHRLSSIKNVDNIIVVKDGQIAEIGNHDELIKENTVYSSMWDQFNKSVQWKVKS